MVFVLKSEDSDYSVSMCCVSVFFHQQSEEKHLTFNNIIKACACQVAMEE